MVSPVCPPSVCKYSVLLPPRPPSVPPAYPPPRTLPSTIAEHTGDALLVSFSESIFGKL